MRDRLTLIIAITALVVAVLGTTPIGEAAYNAVVPKNSVGAQQLRKGAVTSVKIRGDAVTSGKVKNRSLKAIDFKLGQLPAGAVGAKGDKGDKGEKGDAGATEVTVRSSAMSTTGAGRANLTVNCLSGERAVSGGGGLQAPGSSSAVKLVSSKPVPSTSGATPTGWNSTIEFAAAGLAIAAYAVCVKP